jgi:hypothetical protein
VEIRDRAALIPLVGRASAVSPLRVNESGETCKTGHQELELKRRQFLTYFVGAAAASAFVARGQSSHRMRRIGVLMLYPENDLLCRRPQLGATVTGCTGG